MPKEDPDRLVGAVGRRIAELRRARCLTQEQLAERLNVSVQYVSRVERGENLSIHTLARFANALRMRVVDLFKPPAPNARGRRQGRPKKPR